jgi:Flp pilus assembly protein TadD
MHGSAVRTNAWLLAVVVPLVVLLLAGCSSESESGDTDVETEPRVSAAHAEYVGSEACQSCHEDQFRDWDASQHYLAMQPATTQTVVGDFEDTSLEYAGIDYRFSNADGKFYVQADDSNGDVRRFEISHTFGVYPLQQYLVPMPNGRYQALSIAWDTRLADEGGQRWFHLYPDETITHTDELHWTGRNQNWNYMCADCHSTDLRKGYDLASKTYATTWEEISVGCEACHGPGSTHVTSAAGLTGDEPDGVAALTLQKEQIDTCARCHSRRGILAEGFTPGDEFLDHYRPALLDDGLYHPDGQILDEVYVYGSFLQSKMYQKAVRCTDCHDPHTATLKRPGNETCTFCHQNQPPDGFPTLVATAYDSPDHHFHESGTAGAQCVSCHMPSQDYMVVDPRRDHSFRIPRPDLSATLGVPNACNNCHDDQTASWAVNEINKRFPDASAAHYGDAIAAGRRGDPGAVEKLVALADDASAPAIVRGTALSLLAGFDTEQSTVALAAGLNHEESLIRLGALYGLRTMDHERRWRYAAHLLDDPLLVIRTEAAVTLASALNAGIGQADRERLVAAVGEYVSGQLLNADRPEALTNLGSVYASVGNDEDAERAFRHALDIDAEWVTALVNLADLYRVRGRDDEGAELLARAISITPENGDVRYAYGLLLVRQGQADAALAELEQAAGLRPGNAVYAYTLGIALNSLGRADDGIAVLVAALERFPQNTDILMALATIERDRSNPAAALDYAMRLQRLRPLDRNLQALIAQLQSEIAD